jgi:hypothetical protein
MNATWWRKGRGGRRRRRKRTRRRGGGGRGECSYVRGKKNSLFTTIEKGDEREGFECLFRKKRIKMSV